MGVLQFILQHALTFFFSRKSLHESTIYDQIINEQLQSNWREYCQGNVTEEEAMANFYKAINENYPDVVTP